MCCTWMLQMICVSSGLVLLPFVAKKSTGLHPLGVGVVVNEGVFFLYVEIMKMIKPLRIYVSGRQHPSATHLSCLHFIELYFFPTLLVALPFVCTSPAASVHIRALGLAKVLDSSQDQIFSDIIIIKHIQSATFTLRIIGLTITLQMGNRNLLVAHGLLLGVAPAGWDQEALL